MSEELEALKEIREHLYGDVYSGVERRLNIIETALKEKEQQDGVLKILKETIEFNIQEPKMEVKENGEISLLSRIGMSLRKQLNEKERELFREWVLKECFPEELKALEIIKNRKVDVPYIIENPEEENVIWYNTRFMGVSCEGWRMLTQEEYDLVRKVLL